MFEPPILTIKGARLSFGTNELFTNVELYINRGDKISLVGRNGCGKSTLLKVIARDIEPDAGEIFVQPGVKVSYMPQDPDFSGYATLREVVLSGLPEHERGQEYRADILIEQFDIRAAQSPEQSSGGERKKAALAKALINEPDILLLDEPTNHLDMPTIEKLEKIIADFRGAVILISHDRMFLSNTSRTTFWLDRGILRRNNKGFRYFEEWQEQVIDQEIIEQKYLNKKIEEETEWLHKGVTADANAIRGVCAGCSSCVRNAANRLGKSVRSNWRSKKGNCARKWSSRPNTSARLSATGKSSKTFQPVSSKATKSVSSAPTARERPRLSSC